MGRILVNPIRLTALELNIFNVIKEYCWFHDKNNGGFNQRLEPRVAGGWVRDKLLGLESDDIDIVLNNMTGEKFTNGLLDFLFQKGLRQQSSVHKIKKNPEKSKHLETCTTVLYGVPVDFVNLRSEHYSNNSRVPMVDFGTPLQDAMRRDATLNAIFYNITEEKIEDFTGLGLKDLADGLLRTPMSAEQTFLDDPLRILRLIRFAARFQFELDSEALEATRKPEIHECFDKKISRERVGIEIHKILCGPEPLYGIQLIHEAGLLNNVFMCQVESEDSISKRYEDMTAFSSVLIHRIRLLLDECGALNDRYKDPKFRENYLLSLILAPLSGIQIVLKPKGNMHSFAAMIIKEGLKLGKVVAGTIQIAVDSINLYHDMVMNYKALSCSEIGFEIRKLKGHLELCHYVTLSYKYLTEPDEIERRSFLTMYSNFEQHLKASNLNEVHNIKPLLGGKELVKLFSFKEGPWLSDVFELMLKWQMDNQKGTKQELMHWLLKVKGKFISD